MPILLKNHIYHNIKKPKETRYISAIFPMEDRKVSEDLFKDFKDVTIIPDVRLNDLVNRNIEREIMKTIRGEE